MKKESGPFFFGGDTKYEPWANAKGWLTAFDASSGKELWKYEAGKPMIGGVVATAGDLVFTGELTGDLRAFQRQERKRALHTQCRRTNRRRVDKLRVRRKTVRCRGFGLRRRLQPGGP